MMCYNKLEMTSTPPKLVALDLDGTLLTSRGSVTERTACALQRLRAKSVRVVFCTGRPPRHTKLLAAELGLSELVITYNGAAVLNFTTGETTYRHQVPRELALQVIRTLRQQHPEVMLGLETHHGWYLDTPLFELRRPVLEARGLTFPTAHGRSEDFVQDAIIKLLVRHPIQGAVELAEALGDLPIYATWSSRGLLEVMAERTNKQETLAYLCEQWGIAPAEVAAFGDQNNDKEMLAWAGVGVAVANAADEAKAAADFVTGSNDEDGVARVLERWLL